MNRHNTFLLSTTLFLILFSNQIIFSQDGKLDLTFDADGKVTTDIGVGTMDGANSVVVQYDGKIIVLECQ